ARPIPEPAPVMIATLPFTSILYSLTTDLTDSHRLKDESSLLQAWVTEVEQESKPKLRRAQIVDDLRLFDLCDRADRLQLHDERSVAQEVGSVSTCQWPPLYWMEISTSREKGTSRWISSIASAS